MKSGVDVPTRRPNIIPGRFSGKTTWCDYKQHFEASKVANSWSDCLAKVFLAASLQGDAVKVLGNLAAGGSQVKYSELMGLLGKRFGPSKLVENHLVVLRHRQQKPKETLQELRQAVRELVSLTYRELSGEGRYRLARGHFSDAVEEQAVREEIIRARPSSLDEEIRAALNTEGLIKIEEQRNGNQPKHARVVEGQDQYPMDVLKQKMEENTKPGLGRRQYRNRRWGAYRARRFKHSARRHKIWGKTKGETHTIAVSTERRQNAQSAACCYIRVWRNTCLVNMGRGESSAVKGTPTGATIETI